MAFIVILLIFSYLVYTISKLLESHGECVFTHPFRPYSDETNTTCRIMLILDSTIRVFWITAFYTLAINELILFMWLSSKMKKSLHYYHLKSYRYFRLLSAVNMTYFLLSGTYLIIDTITKRSYFEIIKINKENDISSAKIRLMYMLLPHLGQNMDTFLDR